MPNLDVTDKLVNELIQEVAPRVQRLTGWTLPPEACRGRVAPKDQGYEEILLARLRSLGIDPIQVLPAGLVARMLEFMLEENVLAAYQPFSKEILVLRENVDDSNLDGLRLVLGHELVHCAQHRTHPEIFNRIDHELRQTLLPLAAYREVADYSDLVVASMEGVRSDMSLLESHAAYVQNELARYDYPNARIESHFNLAVLFMRLFGGAKLSQYTERVPEVAAAHAARNIQALFSRRA